MTRSLPIRTGARRRLNQFTAAMLLAIFPGAMLAQSSVPQQNTPTAQAAGAQAAAIKPPTGRDKRRAAKIYLDTSKLFTAGRFEEAMSGYRKAAALDPSKTDYRLAADVARSHAVTALVQDAAKDRLHGNPVAARAALAHAMELDPGSYEVTQHLYELGDDVVREQPKPIYEQEANKLGEAARLAPAAGLHSFHFHSDQRQIVQQVFKTYGLETTLDESVHSVRIRFDIDNVAFKDAERALELITGIFCVPLDAHRALVARDTRENRQQYTPLELETVYLSGLTATELTDVGNLAKNVFNVQQAAVEPSAGTITLRAPAATLSTFNATLRSLLDGRNQVLLEVRIIQLAHTRSRNTGVQLPQSMGVFNVAAEAESVFNANQSAIQQIISSGLAAPTDFMAILAILVASGLVSNSPLTGGFATFGGSLANCTNGVFSCSGALTTSALSPGSTSVNFNLGSSDSRQLDAIQLRLGEGEEGSLRMGTRYPIQTSSYSSLGSSSSSIAGLTAAGNSSALSSLLSSLNSSSISVPMVEYQDLGLTLKATPSVTRNNEVSLSLDMKIVALAGSSLNGNPVLNNRAYSGVVTLKQGEAVVVASELDKSQSRAISGTPGVSEIPGMNDLTGKDIQKNYASMLIIITPHVIRGPQAAGHSPMMRIEKNQSTTGR